MDNDFSYAEYRLNSSNGRSPSNSHLRHQVERKAAGERSRRQNGGGSRKATTELSHRQYQSKVFDHNVPLRSGKKLYADRSASDIFNSVPVEEPEPHPYSRDTMKYYGGESMGRHVIGKAQPRQVSAKFEYEKYTRHTPSNPTPQKQAQLNKNAVYEYLRSEYDPYVNSATENKVRNFGQDIFRPPSPPSPIHKERQVAYWDQSSSVEDPNALNRAYADRTYLTPKEKRALENKEMSRRYNESRQQGLTRHELRMRGMSSGLDLPGSSTKTKADEHDIGSYMRHYRHNA